MLPPRSGHQISRTSPFTSFRLPRMKPCTSLRAIRWPALDIFTTHLITEFSLQCKQIPASALWLSHLPHQDVTCNSVPLLKKQSFHSIFPPEIVTSKLTGPFPPIANTQPYGHPCQNCYSGNSPLATDDGVSYAIPNTMASHSRSRLKIPYFQHCSSREAKLCWNFIH